MSFESLGLQIELLRAVSKKGYSTPTPIQQKAIPAVLEGRDLMAGAQTGTGKTAGFTLPLLQRLMSDHQITEGKNGQNRRRIRALVLTPTRELAIQVEESVRDYGKFLPLRATAIFGGVKIQPQISRLRKGVDIIVATPGRLLDHVNQKTINLSKVDILVFDEADRMLDMGFMPDIRKLLALIPKEKQTLFFSATFSKEIKKLANDLLKSPVSIDVAQRNTTAELVTQIIHPVDKNRKRELLSFLIGSQNWRQVLVFTRTRHGADNLTRHLSKDGIKATAIHGDKSQGARSKALADFKSGKARVLVATDIAARGLDINQLPHVVNFELPDSAEDYVHRIGRTGRAGNEGAAISLVCVDELKILKDIERLIKRDLPKEVIANFEPDMSIKPQPVQRGRGKKSSAGKKHTAKPYAKKAASEKRKRRPSFKGPQKNSGRSQGRSQSSAQAY